MIFFRWLRLCLNFLLAIVLALSLFNVNLTVYLLYQAYGQLNIIFNTQSLSSFQTSNKLSINQITNCTLISEIKKFSVDSLNYKPTNNFNSIYNQNNAPVLWVVTASEPYQLKEYLWSFPMLGKLSYKGFFKKNLAQKEFISLKSKGFDVDLRQVSAWSTLGWLNDPLMSSTLNYSKGRFCNLLFHELFHSTFYKPNNVNLNENLAEFIAHYATIKFLNADSASLNQYLIETKNHQVFENFMVKQSKGLNSFYDSIANNPNKHSLKLTKLQKLSNQLNKLPVSINFNISKRKDLINQSKNAYFIDFLQYNSLQDSLELVFNKIYNCNLAKMVQDLKGK
jgi:predicted aminopeptidase